MAVIKDRPAQKSLDKMADCWSDIHELEPRIESFVSVITETDDSDVETDLLPTAEVTDANLTDGTEFHPKVSEFLRALIAHLQNVGGHSGLTDYLQTRHWRAHQYAAERCYGDSNIGADLPRLQVCPEDTWLAEHLQGTGYTDMDDIAVTAGPARMRCSIIAKGAAIWTPDIHAVCEGPVTTLDGAINDVVTTIVCADSSEFPAPTGCIIVENEAITYTGNDGTTLTGCTRNAYGTAAAAHEHNMPVRNVETYAPSIRAAAQVGLRVDLDVAAIDDISPAGGTGLESTGIGGGGTHWLVGSHALVRDHSSPELLTQDCTTDDHLHVADPSAFKPGDHILIHDATPDTEWATIHDVDETNGIILLDANTANTYTTALNALVCLAFTTINELAVFAFNDMTLTVTDTTGFPAGGGTLLIDDEEMTYSGYVGNDLTITARGANDTFATAHEDGSIVCLVQEGTFPGHNEWHSIATVNADDLVTDDALIHSYYLAGFVAPMLRDVVLTEDGAGGTAGDDIYVMAESDRLIHKAG